MLRALVVDHSAENADLLTSHLRRAGFQLAIERAQTKSGLEAALDGQDWDVVLCDLEMTHPSGLDALQTVRERDPHLPVIVIAAPGSAQAAEDARNRGARDCVERSDAERLLLAIERELRAPAMPSATAGEIGQGTTVRLEPPPPDAGTPQRMPSDRPQAEPERIDAVVLVVEDNAEVRKIVCRLLRDLDCTVLEAGGAAAALEVLRTDRRIDLVFSDVVMPGGMSGMELAREARRLRPGLKTLLTTGFAEASLRSQMQLSGADAIIPKPYRRQDLALKLRSILGSGD